METHLKFHSSAGKRTVFVVEDEFINRELLRMMLSDTFEVHFAETGEEAVKGIKAEHEIISLILLDLNLPDMHGLDLLKIIKEDELTAQIPVIVMTAEKQAEVESLKLGAIDFISKPYPATEVVMARIQRTIELSEDRDIIQYTERDPLTGLYNRDYFYRYAAQYDTFHKDLSTDAVVVDINHFHVINERYGRAFGDALLKRVGSMIKEHVEESGGIVCRKEADTFMIYCPHREDYTSLMKHLAEDASEDSHLLVRMGIYSDTDKSIDMEHRFDRAKSAADTVKNNFTKTIAIYDDSLRQKEMFEEQLVEDFHAAIREDQFAVYFQPKFNIRGSEPVLSSAEALVRWMHPDLGMVSPGVFIPLFEDNGLIQELDHYVWRQAAKKISEWKETLGRSIPVSVNVSRIDMYDPHLVDNLKGLVEEFGLQAGELLLEITESAYTQDSGQIIKTVNELRKNGFMIEMDDFGSGYSSLNMLSTLPIDAIKLDMQFIRNAFRERKNTQLLEFVISLSESLSVPTIAEGVETAEQMFTLKNMGCAIAQGYYFSRPLPAEEFEAFVREQTAEAEEELPQGRTSAIKDRYTYDALHDPLTGMYNHSAFDIMFHDSDKDHICVLLLCVDDYDEIKKLKGKKQTDMMIKRVAGVLKDSFRNIDDICRLQEDEFVIIMHRMMTARQGLVSDKVMNINGILRNAEEGEIPASLSAGIAFSDRKDPQGDIFEDADRALIKAKQVRSSGCVVY